MIGRFQIGKLLLKNLAVGDLLAVEHLAGAGIIDHTVHQRHHKPFHRELRPGRGERGAHQKCRALLNNALGEQRGAVAELDQQIGILGRVDAVAGINLDGIELALLILEQAFKDRVIPLKFLQGEELAGAAGGAAQRQQVAKAQGVEKLAVLGNHDLVAGNDQSAAALLAKITQALHQGGGELV